MQLFTKQSEEGVLPGLGWVDGETVRFRFDPQQNALKIPHMGWNAVSIKKEGTLFKGMEIDARFYFVHSYHIRCNDETDVLASTDYGYSFASAIQRGNIMGVQFHPEKSHKYGMQVLKNFLEVA
jgi:glutamine amidotransferase